MLRIRLGISLLLLAVTTHAQQRELDSLLAVLRSHPQNDTVKLNLLNSLASTYKNIDPDKGLLMADRAIALANRLNYPSKLAVAFTQKGNNYLAKGEDSLALIQHQQALRLHQRAGNELGVAIALHNIGLFYFNQSNYLKALNHHRQAAILFRQLNKREYMLAALSSTGLNYMYLGQYPEALKYYLNVLKISQQAGDKRSMGSALINTGLLYNRMANYEKALTCQTKALRLYEQIDHRLGVANTLGNIASIYDFQRKPVKALAYYERALAVNRSISNKRGMASDIVNIGVVHHDQGQFVKALPYLQQALHLYEQVDDKHSLCIALKYLGDWYARVPDELLKKQGIVPAQRYSQVLIYQQRALQTAQAINALEQQSDAWEALSETYVAQQKYALALTAYKHHVSLRDSLLNEEKRTEITRQEMRFEQDKREAVLNAQHTAEIKQRQTERNATLGGGGLLLLAVAAGFALYKRKREAGEQAREADLKAEIADTQMKVLRAQMNPHFIFNSLNSISDYMLKNDTKTADFYLTKFAKLMRMILENSEKNEVLLADDLQTLELYMQLEAMRMRDRFTYEIQVDDAVDPDETLIPPLLLQPFVENSIWHGLAWKEGVGKITVRIQKEGDMINCIVEDNGIGRKRAKAAGAVPETAGRKSLGMTITQARIALINQQKQTNAVITLSDLHEGTRVEVKVPLAFSV